MSRSLRWSLSLLLLASLLGWPKPAASIAPNAPSNTFSVTSTEDLIDSAVGNGSCLASNGHCTLRAAVMEANALGGAHTIILSAATYTLTIDPVAGDTAGLNGDLDITDTVSINLLVLTGQAVIDAGNKDRAFEVFAATLDLQDVTVRNGAAIGLAGVYNHAGGTVTIDRSEISGHTGAGILNDGGILTVKNSLVTGNTASGIYNQNNGSVNVMNSTLSGNSGTNGGGVYIGSGSLTLNNVTLANNTAFNGGGLYRQSGIVVMSNSIVALNSAGSNADCSGVLTAVFTSLIQNTTGCTFSGSGNITGQNPQLSALQNNGGRTRTHALLLGSPAINAGLNCVNENSPPINADQRGSFRPQGSACDMGAYEMPAAQFSASTYTAAENVGNALITVSLDGTSALTVTVPYTASAGTATASSDFTPVTGTLTIPANAASASFSVPVVNDAMDEPDETVMLTIGQPGGALLETPSTATLTIQDNDAPPSVAFASALYTATEPSGSALITATLSVASGWPITVTYATSNGTALAGSDYTAASNQLAFAPGLTRTTFTVPVINDSQNEPLESLTLTLSNPQNAALGAPNPATLTIVSEDPPRVYLPLMMRNYFACYTGAGEIEPNDTYPQATGPLCAGRTYAGTHAGGTDQDYFTFIMPADGTFTINVVPTGLSTSWQMQLFFNTVSSGTLVGLRRSAPFQLTCPGMSEDGYTCSGAAGTYYLRLILPSGVGYNLTINSP